MKGDALDFDTQALAYQKYAADSNSLTQAAEFLTLAPDPELNHFFILRILAIMDLWQKTDEAGDNEYNGVMLAIDERMPSLTETDYARLEKHSEWASLMEGSNTLSVRAA